MGRRVCFCLCECRGRHTRLPLLQLRGTQRRRLIKRQSALDRLTSPMEVSIRVWSTITLLPGWAVSWECMWMCMCTYHVLFFLKYLLLSLSDEFLLNPLCDLIILAFSRRACVCAIGSGCRKKRENHTIINKLKKTVHVDSPHYSKVAVPSLTRLYSK